MRMSTYGSTSLWSCDREGCQNVAGALLDFLPQGWVSHGDTQWCAQCARGEFVPMPRPPLSLPASPYRDAWQAQRERRKRRTITRALWTLAAACAVAACAIVARGCS